VTREKCLKIQGKKGWKGKNFRKEVNIHNFSYDSDPIRIRNYDFEVQKRGFRSGTT
jgi:hypothetical protein